MKQLCSIILLALLNILSVCFASVPQQIHFQGYLTRPDGTALDTIITVTFRIYDVANEGTALWTETQSACSVRTGLFNVTLGSQTALPQTIFSGTDRWLGFAVGTDEEMVPRSKLNSVAYAYRVGTVDGSSGGIISGALQADTLKPVQGIRFNDGTLQRTSADTTGLATRAWIQSCGYLRGSQNTISASGFVGGGNNNKALGLYSTVGGGGGGTAVDSNRAGGDRSTIGGGARNQTAGSNATVGGGHTNSAVGTASTIAGGYMNEALYTYSTVSGGYTNIASEGAATVSGGRYNRARGYCSFVGGGGGDLPADSNSALAEHSTIGGGWQNVASGSSSTIAGGYINQAIGDYSAVSGGQYNRARGNYSVIGGGGGVSEEDSNSTIGNRSTVAGGTRNYAKGHRSTVGGGYNNDAIGEASTISGGFTNQAIGDYTTVTGGNQNTAVRTWTTVSGGMNNYADSAGATISGGRDNIASGPFSTISGGDQNNAASTWTTVGGGINNSADSAGATIGGGRDNIASGPSSTIAGGYLNTASGTYAIVPGGVNNAATGYCSFAAGRRAKALYEGSFVWGDNSDLDISATANNQFLARCRGGVYFYSNRELTTGSYLAAGGGSWNSISDSTKKRNIRLVDTREILSKVALLPIKQWSYKSQDAAIEHIGPMAQDFHSLFPLGDDPLTINTVDPDGIALAAIQELVKRVSALEKQNSELQAQVQTLMAGKSKASKEK
jgi:trimeric autotransporter adhesin